MTALTHPGKLLKTTLLAALTLGGLTAFTSRSEASSAALRSNLKGLAGDIKKVLDWRGETKIAVGQFAGSSPHLPVYAGPGLTLILKGELQKLGVAVKPRAEVALGGKFVRLGDGKDRPAAFELRVELVDKDDKQLQEFRCGIVDPADIALILGAIGPLGSGSREDRTRELWERLAHPRPTLVGTRVYSHPKQPYAMEILVENRPRKAALEEMLPFVKIDRGESYAIRLYNHSDEDAVVLLAIDGINVFAFNKDPEKDGSVRGDHLVFVRKGGSAIVRGWYRKNGKSDAFMVTKYSESAAGKLGVTADVGTITALFRVSRKKAPPPPPPLPKTAAVKYLKRDGTYGYGGVQPMSKTVTIASHKGASSGTGFGESVPEAYTIVGNQVLSPVRDIITVRYTRD